MYLGLGSGSGDEELLIVTSKPRLVTTTPPVNTTTPPPVVDGSGDGEFVFAEKAKEESSWWNPFADDPNVLIKQSLFSTYCQI